MVRRKGRRDLAIIVKVIKQQRPVIQELEHVVEVVWCDDGRQDIYSSSLLEVVSESR